MGGLRKEKRGPRGLKVGLILEITQKNFEENLVRKFILVFGYHL
jgi:hypothetical protein